MQQPPVLKQDDLQYIVGGLIAGSPRVHLAPDAIAGRIQAVAP